MILYYELIQLLRNYPNEIVQKYKNHNVLRFIATAVILNDLKKKKRENPKVQKIRKWLSKLRYKQFDGVL